MNILTKRRLNRMLVVFCLVVSVSLLMLGSRNSAMINNGHDDEIRQLISKLESSSQQERRDAILSLHRFGKDAIPFLIDNISNSKEIYIGLGSPMNSDMRLSLEAKTYAGTLAAFVIELILNRAQIKLDKNDHPQFLLGNSQDNYVFWEGVIAKNKGLAKMADLPRIKKLYQKWWELNKAETIERLREKQKGGESILDRKPYYWK